MNNALDELIRKAKAASQPQEDEAVAVKQGIYDNQRKTVSDAYNKQINDTTVSYDDQYRENAVQKLINERQVAESMANLGLTDSGLNRTQQTAVQLSYANNKAKLDRQKQSAVDALALAMNQQLTDVENNRAADIANVRSSYAQNAVSAGTSAYNAEQDAAVQVQAARIKAEAQVQAEAIKALQEQAKQNSYIIKTDGGLLSRDYFGTLKDNNVGVIYFTDENMNQKVKYIDGNSGKTTVLDIGINPYTGGRPHKDLLDKNGEYDKTKAFSNGYQPNNINGDKLVKDGTITFEGNGITQNVFKTSDGKHWAWAGDINKYVEVEMINGEWNRV